MKKTGKLVNDLAMIVSILAAIVWFISGVLHGSFVMFVLSILHFVVSIYVYRTGPLVEFEIYEEEKEE
jgi:hypothetical protein